MTMRSSLSVSSLVVVVFLTASGVLATMDHIQMHSIFPPILADFWENGLHYWSFGSSSVVTDEYVRLTTSHPTAKGYFWNRHPNHLDSFVLNATLRLRNRKSQWFADATDGGVAMWYTATAPRHMATDLFGNVNAFDGLGVILDHSDTISILTNSEQPVESLARNRLGSCVAKGLDQQYITISVDYNGVSKTLTVRYNVWQSYGVHGVDVECAVLSDVTLPLRNYFGITGSNSIHAQAEHDVVSIYVRPRRREDLTQEEQEEEEAELHLFDAAKEKKLQAEWNGREEPLSAERPEEVDGSKPVIITEGAAESSASS